MSGQAEVIEDLAQEAFASLGEKISNIDFAALKEKIVALLKLSRENING